MKIIFKLLMLFIATTTFGQTIKSRTLFTTDNHPSSSDEVVIPVYYKDTNNFFTPFLGTWTAQVGGNTFVVTLWKETQKPIKDDGGILYYSDDIYGHYKLVQNYNLPNESVIYTSEINFINSPTPIKTIIYATSNYLNKLGGPIYDVNMMTLQKGLGLRGGLEILITGTAPTTATWKVSISEEREHVNFIIPTNLILTKQ